MALLWSVAAHQHPTQESVRHIIDNYGFEDAVKPGATGPGAWQEVKDNYVDGHPANEKVRADIARRGIQKPIAIDYHRDPPVVVDGHTRLWHAEALGMETVPVKHGDWWSEHHFPGDEPTGCDEDD